MRASLLTIGDEILIGQILNSNTKWMSEELTELGIQVSQHLSVGDHEAEIVQALDYLLPKSDFLIIGGGLGPTHDDITLKALSHYFEMPLDFDHEWLAKIEEFFKSRNRVMSDNNRKQGFLLKGAKRIDNDCGTAAGQHFVRNESDIFVVPGVPHEMQSMMKRYILPFMSEKNPDQKILKRTLLTTGIGESALATRCEPFVKKIQSRPEFTLAFLPSTTQVKLRLQMKAKDDSAKDEFNLLVEELKEYCGKDFFGFDPTTLQEVVVKQLKARNASLVLAESCTGGMVTHLLTQVGGVSEILKGAIVPYQNEIKIKELGISESFLLENGVVSEATAKSMADGIRKKWSADYGLATTGYLGPNGGDPFASVGTVWMALASDRETATMEFRFEANRERAKERASQAALDLIRRNT